MNDQVEAQSGPLGVAPAELRGAPDTATADDLRGQLEMDALLRLAAGDLAARPGLVGRIRRAVWSRRLYRLVEIVAAAVIVIGLGWCYVAFVSQPRRSIEHTNGPTQSTLPDERPAETNEIDRPPPMNEGQRNQGQQGYDRPTVPPPPVPPGAGAPPISTPGGNDRGGQY